MDIIIFKCDVRNANDRIYPKEVVEKALKDFLERTKNNTSARVLGSLEHQSRISIQTNNIDYGLQQTF